MEVQISNAAALVDGKPELSLDGSTPLNVSAIASESTVSRMVSNSVIKGMVSAVEQELAERISSKEGITNFKNKLRNHDDVLENCRKNIASLEEYKPLIYEQESKKDIQIDNSTAMLQNLVTDLLHEYETSVIDKRTIKNELREKWQRQSNEFANLRQELDDLHKSFISWEQGLVFLHIGHEHLEEQNALKRKEQVHWKPVGNNIASYDENNPILIEEVKEPEMPNFVDSPQFMSMEKELQIHYFKTEMAKMKRQHDGALQEKTEELFSLKRQFFKEKGSSHLNFKKDKEVELMKKRIAETVSKLDNIILENENLTTVFVDEGSCSFREKIDGILLENQRLVSLLAAKKKENLPDCSKVLDTSNQLPNIFVGLELVDQLEKLQWDMDALKIEMSYKDAIIEFIFSQFSCELRDSLDGMEMETQIDKFIYSFILIEVFKDILSRINSIIMKVYEENSSVSKELSEKKKELCLEVDKNKILKQQIESSSMQMKIKENIASDLEADVIQKVEQINSICLEYDVLRDQAVKQGMIIEESKKECDLLKCRLDDRSHEIDQHQAEIKKLNRNLKALSVALSDVEEQRSILQSELVENQAELASQFIKEKEQRKQVELLLGFISELAKSLEELGHKILNIMECNESRLKVLSFQCVELSHKAKKFLSYKELFERRCEDLQKAEIEVDLLADEVDNLISLLGKIYLALDHYSSVLQYYPGVMQILNLIRREIKGEC
ncbi:WPP domain-associated protein-like isoform X2 [Phalaenopsis equestris]|uniref:WPP domain-associated protein-like isoform X2 n=1 Tax=Phalaenopsis equestris TaxID=78828 RepID=UPI0009E656D1|nr:WPP domain-associated protein-like isoform X2 [Phalaenopsis equestris]